MPAVVARFPRPGILGRKGVGTDILEGMDLSDETPQPNSSERRRTSQEAAMLASVLKIGRQKQVPASYDLLFWTRHASRAALAAVIDPRQAMGVDDEGKGEPMIRLDFEAMDYE